MTYFTQLLVASISIGSVYALVALGFVLIYRATNVVNFAQGDFAMAGAYLLVLGLTVLHLPYWAAILLGLGAMAIFGALFALTVYYPLRHKTWIPIVVSTIGVSILMENGTLKIAGPTPRPIRSALGATSLHVGGVVVDGQYGLIIVTTVAVLLFQHWFFEKTVLGKKMQAVSQDKEMALILGIPVVGIILLTFVLSSAIGALAGVLVGPILSANTQFGGTITLKAFAATIIGGFGSVTGAIVGGLAVGLIDTLGGAYISLPYKDAFSFIIVVAVLLVRPQGIFGERVAEKA